MSAAPTDLDRRYGRTSSRRMGRRVWAVVVGAAVAAASIAWVVWGGLLSPESDTEVRDLGYSTTATTTSVDWELTIPAGRTASCAVQALTDNRAVVGWRVVDVPPSEQRTRRFTEQLRTSEPAVTGLIYRCWLT